MIARTENFEIPQEALQESFAELFKEDPLSSEKISGTVVTGTIVALEGGYAIIDVGLKSEGRVPVSEFSSVGHALPELKVGDEVEVYLERMEDREGLVSLSPEKARREKAWVELEKAFQRNERVNGVIFDRVKGGFTVDLNGALAFLPGGQLDVRPIRDVNPLMNIEQPFQILKMDRARGNIVVSRRAILEESRSEARSELLSSLKEGQVLDGIVKNVTDYGAFIDLGGMDGLLHVTDIAWRRINHPSEVLHVSQKIKVQVIRFNPDTQRISLGMKQLEEDPWREVQQKYPVGLTLEGVIVNITDYGAFIELEEGIEGLAHVSDMSWTKKGVHPSHFVSPGQKVQVKILGIDMEKRRISLGMKQCSSNPWETLKERFEVGSTLEGEIKNITEFGLFVGITEDIDGMVHMSDLSWTLSGEEAIRTYKKGQAVKVKVIDIDPERERVVLGIKQLEENPFEKLSEYKRNMIITCEITSVDENGIEVKVGDSIKTYIPRKELAKDRDDRRPDRFAVGEKVDAKIITFEPKSRRISLSIRSREVDEEKKVMAEYGSADSGASLGDILGEAISRVKERQQKEGANKVAQKEVEPEQEESAKVKTTAKSSKKKAAEDATSEGEEELKTDAGAEKEKKKATKKTMAKKEVKEDSSAKTKKK